MLEPGVIFLNHGSFGACPKVVFDAYQQFQRQLESQPVRFMQRELPQLLATSRAKLAEYIGAEHDDVVFVTNPTFAANEIAKSLKLGVGDEVLVSDQEYGACHNAWTFMSQKCGFSIVEQPIRLPVESNEQMVEDFWSGVTDNTKVIFLSQITSKTALTIPVREICHRARERGEIITVIDGAHAPAQIDVDMKDIDADFYTATCHKWLCAPKGSAFLYARKEVQHLLEPLIVGWGWGPDRLFDSGSDFLDYHEWLGTHDPSRFLAVPAAIDFQAKHHWHEVRERCQQFAREFVRQANELDGVRRVHADEFYQQLALVELVNGGDEKEIKANLYDKHRVEVPVFRWSNRVFVRASWQAYNTNHDVDAAVHALRETI